jgi:hypothetical protein
MSKKKRKKILLSEIKWSTNEIVNGGFRVLYLINAVAIFGGEQTNNCNGGNCAAGCGKGQNTAFGCGANWIPGCGPA